MRDNDGVAPEMGKSDGAAETVSQFYACREAVGVASEISHSRPNTKWGGAIVIRAQKQSFLDRQTAFQMQYTLSILLRHFHYGVCLRLYRRL